jgi:hypothetical protein
MDPYYLAQSGVARLKTAVRKILADAPEGGLTNAQVGRTLGIYSGHVGHEGHISRTLLGMLENEGVVQQDSTTKSWRLINHSSRAE